MLDITIIHYYFITDNHLTMNHVIELRRPDSNVVQTCAKHTTQRFSRYETKRVSCRPGVTGRFVRITRLGSTPRAMSLFEVKVYGIYGNT